MCVFYEQKFRGTIINIGTGKDFKIKEYVKIIGNVIAPGKKIKIDRTKPNGTPRKLLSIGLSKSMDGDLKLI